LKEALEVTHGQTCLSHAVELGIVDDEKQICIADGSGLPCDAKKKINNKSSGPAVRNLAKASRTLASVACSFVNIKECPPAQIVRPRRLKEFRDRDGVGIGIFEIRDATAFMRNFGKPIRSAYL